MHQTVPDDKDVTRQLRIAAARAASIFCHCVFVLGTKKNQIAYNFRIFYKEQHCSVTLDATQLHHTHSHTHTHIFEYTKYVYWQWHAAERQTGSERERERESGEEII